MLPNITVKDSHRLGTVHLKRKVTGDVQDATEVVHDATYAVTNTVETSQDAVPETVAAESVKVEKVAESADHGGNGANELPYGHWRGRPRDTY